MTIVLYCAGGQFTLAPQHAPAEVHERLDSGAPQTFELAAGGQVTVKVGDRQWALEELPAIPPLT